MDVDKVAFTGEYTTGQIIMEAAAQSNLKRVSLELGGKSPNVVFADADLDAAVEGAYLRPVLQPGPVLLCRQPVVRRGQGPRSVRREAGEEGASTQKVGDPFDPATDAGAAGVAGAGRPHHGLHRRRQEGRRQAADAAAIASAIAGYFIEPTVFDDVKDEMKIAREEIFGPVMNILQFKDINEVIRRGNQTFYGLAAAVWTRDIKKAHRLANSLRAGTVWINCYDVFDAAAPFGGFKMSGIGRELGEYALANVHRGEDGVREFGLSVRRIRTTGTQTHRLRLSVEAAAPLSRKRCLRGSNGASP